MTVYIVTDGRGFARAFTDQTQAEGFAEASGNPVFETDILSEVDGAAFLRDYTEAEF